MYSPCEKKGRPFIDPESLRKGEPETIFSADCLTLEMILDNSGLRGQRIDLMSVDVETGELAVFEEFPFSDFDIRILVVEWMAGKHASNR